MPNIRIDHLSDAEERAYIIADNRLAEKAGWDKLILAIVFQALVDLDFDVTLTGFEVPEIDLSRPHPLRPRPTRKAAPTA